MATPPGRSFAVNSDLHFSFLVYNATPNLVLQTKLFRDGKVAKANAETAIDLTNKDGVGPSLITNVMRLTPELEPGDYYLQVMIPDKAAKNKICGVAVGRLPNREGTLCTKRHCRTVAASPPRCEARLRLAATV